MKALRFVNLFAFFGLLVLFVLVRSVWLNLPSPEGSEFSPGDQAVVVGPNCVLWPDVDMLAPGVRLTVGRDDGGFDSRKIAVAVESGEHKDKSGTVARSCVRPL